LKQVSLCSDSFERGFDAGLGVFCLRVEVGESQMATPPRIIDTKLATMLAVSMLMLMCARRVTTRLTGQRKEKMNERY
jgi:hypothetical protein